MAANEFDQPFVAQTYDLVEGERSDLDVYVELAADLNASSVLDIGCGTGVLALRLAAEGRQVTGVEPAGEMLAVAQAKPGADAVRWIHGVAPDVPTSLRADLAVMTANVAQVFTSDDDWLATLRAVAAVLRPGGTIAFEARNPADRAWERWAKQPTRSFDAPGLGTVHNTFELLDVELPLIRFQSVNHLPDGTVVPAESTLIFRTEQQLLSSLAEAGFVEVDVSPLPLAPEGAWFLTARTSGG